jgi:hypothetical protein
VFFEVALSGPLFTSLHKQAACCVFMVPPGPHIIHAGRLQ